MQEAAICSKRWRQWRGIMILLLIGCWCHVSRTDQPAHFGQKSSYRAAVFEHVDPSNEALQLQDIMLISVAEYERQIQVAADLEVDIIVFPEYGITGLSVPDSRTEIQPVLQVLPSIEPEVSSLWIPCLDADDEFNVTILKRLSCAARTSNLTVVANVGTLVACNDSSCPQDGHYQFNTDVVFGTDGAILATYHKINLYHEPMFDRPPFPPGHVTTFVTDFAVTFGLITCFDLLWYNPLIYLVANNGVQRVVMSSAWIDGLPFLTSVQSQMSWSIGLNIDLIVANVQRSQDGFRGSGIYHGKDGYITYTYGATNASQLLIADVPLDNVTVSFSKNRTELPVEYDGIIYDDLSNYTFVELSDHSSGMTLLSTGNLSCAVWYKFEDSITDGSYFLAGYDGYITLGDGEYYLAVQTCAVMWCRNASFSQCVHPPVTSEIYLVNLTLEGNFSTSYIYPSSLQHDLLPINTNVWKFEQMSLPEVIGDSSVITSARIITQNGFHYRPAVIGLYGRLYDLDTS